MESILEYLGSNVNYLYTFVIHIVLIISTFIISRSIFKRFKLVPIYRNYIGYFWLSAALFWLTNIIQIFLNLNSYDFAYYLSYGAFFFLMVQSIILFTYFLSIIFNQYRFSPVIFFISLLFNALGTFFFFIQKDLFYFTNNLWTKQALINPQFALYILYTIIAPLAILIIIFLIQIIYYIFKKKYHPLHKLNLYVSFTLLLHIALFVLYYSELIISWKNIILLLILLLPLLFTYILLVKNTYYQESIINPANKNNIIKIPLLLKFIFGTLLALIIPLTLANSVIYILYETTMLGNIVNFSAHLAIINCFILVFAFAFNTILAKKNIYRLESLMKGTHEIQQENLSYQIPLEGSDEITALTISFNTMIKDLKDYKEELKNYSIILEEEIEKQTRELRTKRREAESLAEQNMTLYKQLSKQTGTIIDNITDSLLVLDDKNNIMTINKIFLEKFGIETSPLGQEFSSLAFVKEYELMKIVQMFREQTLKKYNFRLNLTKPYYGVLQCYMSIIDLDNDKKGILFLLQDTTPPWGTVLDSSNYEPVNLAIVRLFDNSNNKLVETAVTDDNGRFGFFVKPGGYYITVGKDEYHFPSQNRAGYHGEMIDVRSKEEGIIKVNILMDPTTNIRTGITAEEKRQEGIILETKDSLPGNIQSTSMEKIEAKAGSLTDLAKADAETMGERKAPSITPPKVNANKATKKKVETKIPEMIVETKIPTTKPVIEEKKDIDLSTIKPDIQNPAVKTPDKVMPSSSAVSDRAQRAKEAKKAAKGNVNVEEKPGAMLEKIEHMIEEEKKIKGADKNGNDITNTIAE